MVSCVLTVPLDSELKQAADAAVILRRMTFRCSSISLWLKQRKGSSPAVPLVFHRCSTPCRGVAVPLFLSVANLCVEFVV